MKKEVTLTIKERYSCLEILNDFKGPLEVLAKILDDVKLISISEDEWKEVEKKEIPLANGTTNITWNSEKDSAKTIQLEEKVCDYIKSTIDRKDKDGELTIRDASLVQLREKLK